MWYSLKHCSRGCTRWTGDLHLGLHPDFVRPFHIPTDPTWPHSIQARTPWTKTHLRKKILYGKTAKATHSHQKKVPKRTFLANLAVRISENHHRTRQAYPAPPTRPTCTCTTTTSPALHLTVAHHHHAAAPQRTTRAHRRSTAPSTPDHYIFALQPNMLDKMYDSDLAARPPPRFLALQTCCARATRCIR